MSISSIILGIGFILALMALSYWLFQRLTLQIDERSEGLFLSYGRLMKRYTEPGLHWVPQRIYPWNETIVISKQVDFRSYKGIQVNDRNGTTIIVDLWIEFQITDVYKALFAVENWEDVLQSVVIHSVASILSAQKIEEILRHRNELADQLKKSISIETERWGISLKGAMIQNVGLLPEISKQFFQTVAARIERITALVKEEGRLRVAHLDASTSKQIAVLNGMAQSQAALQIGHFYKELSKDPVTLNNFKNYWELMKLDPQRTVSFSGFSKSPLSANHAIDTLETVEAIKNQWR